MVLIEAMAMGVPVVAGEKSGGVPWVLKDGGGLLVNVTDVKSIINGLLELSVPRQYVKFALAARNIALNRFTQKVILDVYINELKKICKWKYCTF